MQTTSADYKTAIAATDREIRGYLKFNNSFVMRGSDGLISFKTTQNSMDAERYCLGSVTSAYCEASFFNSALDGSGISLANSYFDAYIGVCTDEPDSPDVDLKTVTVYENGHTTVALIGKKISDMNGVASVGSPVTVTANGVEYHGTVVLNGTLLEVNFDDATDFTLEQKLDLLVANWYIYCDPIYVGDLKIDVGKMCVEYVCCGRYWVSEITRTAKTTNIAGYDVAGRLSMDYVCTVTPDPDNGFLVMDVLNDIIDQTGVNNGVHFSTFGDSTYVPALVEGNCKSQWGWLCTIAGNDDVNEYTGKREPADLGYVGTYYAGNGTSAYAITDDTLYMDGFNAGDEFTITSLTTGTKENPIVVGNGFGINSTNPYIDNTKATAIEGTVDNYQYYPVTLKWRGDPCLDVMDELSVTHDGVTYKTLCMKIVTTFNGGLQQDITAWADSEAFYALSTSPMETKIQTVSNLVSEIAQAIETADGGVITKILDTDGTWKELVIANNQDLSQATSVWRFNINGLAHSDRYQGGTYTLAMDTQGRIVANVIQTGILQDANGKNSWNLDTGALTITDGSISITTSNTSLDIIQFNGDDRNNQGLGYVYNTKMQPKMFETEGHWYTPSSHEFGVCRVTSSSNNFIAKWGVYSNEQPTEVFATKYTYYAADGVTMYSTYGIGAEPVEVGSFPNGTDFTDEVSVYNSRGTLAANSTFRKWGNFRFVSAQFNSSYNGTSSTERILTLGASNAPTIPQALSCVDITSGTGYVDGTAAVKVDTNGNVYMNMAVNGHKYAITGLYYTSY